MVSFNSRIVNSPSQKQPIACGGLCRVENHSGPLFRGNSRTARHNPVPGIIPIMPLPA